MGLGQRRSDMADLMHMYISSNMSPMMYIIMCASLTLARVGGGLQYLVGLCVCLSVCLSVTTKLLFKLNYLKIWTCYSSESLQRVSNPALLQGSQILEGTGDSDCSEIWKCKNFMYRDEMKCLCNKTKASTDVTHDIRKIICKDLWRNVRVWRYDVVHWPCPSPCCQQDR